MKEAKRSKITKQMCKQAQLMRKGGASQTEIAVLLGVNACTISRIEAAGFDWEAYMEAGKIRREREKNGQKEPTEPEKVEQVPGQIEMDLTTEGKAEMNEQTKMMRFQAAQVDKLIMKLDQIYNVASMILRAIRKE